jgi:hypothetical protein
MISPLVTARAGKPPRSGLSRSDFVLWPMTSLTAMQHHTRFWGIIGENNRSIIKNINKTNTYKKE